MRRRALNAGLALAGPWIWGAKSWAAAGKARGKTLGQVTVEAGPHDRRNTPVTIRLPPALAGQPLELAPSAGPSLPVTVAPDGRGFFMLPALAAGKRTRFALRPARPSAPAAKTDASAGVTVARTPDGVDFSLGQSRVFRYQTVGRAPRPDVPPQAVRAGYLHPLQTPRGLVVTDDYHPKHRGHHGIWTAWTAAEFEGRKLSLWGGDSAKNDFVALDETFAGAAAGGLRARHQTVDLTVKPAKPILDERWQVLLHRTHAGAPPYFLVDLEWTDSVIGSAPLRLSQYRYGGLGVRGNGAWDGPDKLFVLTSEGRDRAGGEGSTGRWIHMGGLVQGQLCGIAVLVHPENFRAPQPFRVHPNEPFVSVAPAKAGDFAIEPGRPYLSRYRFVVADGGPDRALLDRLWNDYARPPVVSHDAAALL
jgi:hypothetical protein